MKKFGSRLILGGIDVVPYFHDAEMLGVLGGRERQSKDENWTGLVPFGHLASTYRIGPYSIVPDYYPVEVNEEGPTELGGVAILTEHATGQEVCTASFMTLHCFVNDHQRQSAQRFMTMVLCLADDEGVTLRVGHDGTEASKEDGADQWHNERHLYLGGLNPTHTVRHRDNRDLLEVDGKVIIEITHYPNEGVVVAKSREPEIPFVYLGRRLSTHWVETIMHASASGTAQADWITSTQRAERLALGNGLLATQIDYK